MNRLFRIALAAGLLAGALPAGAASPDDVVPGGSGLYDALATLATQHALAANAPDAADLQGVTGRLYTYGEFAQWVGSVPAEPHDRRAVAALAFARNVLAQYLTPDTQPSQGAGTTLGVGGLLEPEVRGQDDHGGSLKSRGEILGRGRLLGTLGRDGAFTADITNLYRQTRQNESVSTRGGGDNPDVLNGVDEAYVTALGRKGLRVTLGELRQRWGSGYRGEMLINDNAPSHPTLQVEFPFSLGHVLGDYRFTQFAASYRNQGITVTQGGRRLEHAFGDRTTLSLEESYLSNNFSHPDVLIEPFYAYQKIHYSNNVEPSVFNYQLNAGVTVHPGGPSDSARLYAQFLIDDIQAPQGFRRNYSTPRKVGTLIGYAQSFPRTGTDAVIEYARTDPQTYTKLPPYPPGLAQFDGGLPLGHPIGPNGQELFARVGQRLGSLWSVSVAGRLRRRPSADFPAPKQNALNVALAYRLGPSRSLGLRYDDYREDVYPYAVTPANTSSGGAVYGESLRRHVLGLSFLQSF